MKVRGWLIILTIIFMVGGLWQAGGATYIHAKAWLAQVLLENAWVDRLAGREGVDIKPWPWADTTPVARISVPHLGVDQIVLADASARTLAFGPVHLVGTALPGERGHSVLIGHRDTHFRFLKDLNAGDVVELQQADGSRTKFKVTGTEVFDARTARFSAGDDQRALTLVTCYPFNSTQTGKPHRYAVFMEAK
ncbi:MAG: class GN sortase [Proteobacteria bacterium]|nr:class GN sortase [Pseudomonadota bacterium]